VLREQRAVLGVAERLKLFAVFSKHRGFREENEWRVVYMRERDTNKALESMFSYWVGPRGVEQKLKLKVAAIPGFPETEITLDKIVERIILGPSFSTPLARGAIDQKTGTLKPVPGSPFKTAKGAAQKEIPTRMAASVTRKLCRNHN
jgi:hypothetical protein